MTRIHLIGIGGTGLSAIARILLEMGTVVTGSDRAESVFTRDLTQAGAKTRMGTVFVSGFVSNFVLCASNNLDKLSPINNKRIYAC